MNNPKIGCRYLYSDYEAKNIDNLCIVEILWVERPIKFGLQHIKVNLIRGNNSYGIGIDSWRFDIGVWLELKNQDTPNDKYL